MTKLDGEAILFSMTIETHYIVFPDNDAQEIEHELTIDQLVDINGYPVQAGQAGANLVYRVQKIRRAERTGVIDVFYYLEQLNIFELRDMRGF